MIKTSEMARRGHPDRTCDIMSDSLVDEFLKQDPDSRVAIDVVGGHNMVYVIGEVTTKGYVDIPTTIREVYKEIGYKDEIGVIVNISEQSPEINSKAVNGAGDSGIMVGYATRETPEMLPLETALAKRVADKLDELDILEPDGKVQVTTENGKIKIIVMAYQVDKDNESFAEGIIRAEMYDLLKEYLTDKTQWIFIPFNIGGFDADSGLTGRKNVLWYGPRIPTGGGAFAGKDATKVDRSGAYFARKIAIEYLKTYDEVLVEIAFVIGKEEPVMFKINGKEEDCPFTVQGIIKALDLKKPIFKQASWFGHFGNNQFSWEK